VRLQVTSDEDDVLHVHGFEVEEPLEAGRTTTVDLTADQPGVFEVETHETELELLQLEVR
jgi:heme/copper-type cytochrome/quinol oxidase subunit 2